jgi:hypothetical protein
MEQALHSARREIRAVASHSVRNTVVLLMILLAAASLTVWITHGVKTETSPSTPAPTSAQRALPEDSLESDWDTFELEGVDSIGPEDNWAGGTKLPASPASTTAPRLDAWPPPASESQFRSLAEGLPPAAPEASALPEPVEETPPGGADRTPVANLLNMIEPPPVRR